MLASPIASVSQPERTCKADMPITDCKRDAAGNGDKDSEKGGDSMSENYLEASEYFAMDEYFNRTHDVKCLMCGKRITATQDDLDRLGWSLNRNGEFCDKDKQYANPETFESDSVTPISHILRNRANNGQRGVVLS